MENPNPKIQWESTVLPDEDGGAFDAAAGNPLSAGRVFCWIRTINDPEHPLTLEQLSVVSPGDIAVDNDGRRVHVAFTPTIPHCSMATLIGLCIRVRLGERLGPSFTASVAVKEGAHVSELAINKQLADKERVAAAMENDDLARVVLACLDGPPRMGIAL